MIRFPTPQLNTPSSNQGPARPRRRDPHIPGSGPRQSEPRTATWHARSAEAAAQERTGSRLNTGSAAQPFPEAAT